MGHICLCGLEQVERIYNQLQNCWDTPMKKRPFLLQIATIESQVCEIQYWPPLSLPFKVVPPSFEDGLVLLATLMWGGGGIASTRSWTGHLIQNTVFIVSQVLLQLVVEKHMALNWVGASDVNVIFQVQTLAVMGGRAEVGLDAVFLSSLRVRLGQFSKKKKTNKSLLGFKLNLSNLKMFFAYP